MSREEAIQKYKESLYGTGLSEMEFIEKVKEFEANLDKEQEELVLLVQSLSDQVKSLNDTVTMLFEQVMTGGN